MSSTEAVVRRFFEELWNAGRLEAVGEVVASDHVHHLPDRDVRGPDGVRRMVTNLRTAFPDLVFRLDDVVVGADKVAVRWTALGTHEGPLGDLEATGRRVTWTGIDIVRVLDGRIVELWASPDAMGHYEQLTAAESPSSR